MKKPNPELLKQYKELHEKQWGYGRGLTHYSKILDTIQRHPIKSVIDFGCGKGMIIDRLRKSFNNSVGGRLIKFTGYDPAIERFSEYPESADMLIANDVFEHFHPDEIGWDLMEINRLGTHLIFANISCRPAVHNLPNGKNCHTTLRDWKIWIDYCDRFFVGKELMECRYENSNKSLMVIYKTMEF